MAAYTEGKVPGDWLKGEQRDPRDYSREAIVILAGSGAERRLTSGMVLGKVTKGTATAAAVSGNTGNGTMGPVTVGAAAKAGVYRLTCIEPAPNAGKFLLEDPEGIVVGTVTVAVAFSGGGLSFTLADGSTDFASGDAFTVTVAAGSGKFVQIDKTGTDGREDAAGLLYLDASAPDGEDGKGVAIVRNAVVSANGITWPSDFDSNDKAAAVQQLAALGILVAA
jgi:hypothetical protein